MDYLNIEFNEHDGIARIWLNRPDKLNSFTTGMHRELADALGRVEQGGARVLVLSGRGRGFCAGQDLADAQPGGSGADTDLGALVDTWYAPLIRRLNALPLPVVVGVNGVAAGAGASVALSCDIVIAAESAKFIQAFARIGLVPDAGGTHFWPRMVGMQRAMGAALFAEPVTAVQAEQWGLIWRSVPDDALEATIQDMHDRLAKGATRAFAATKKALYESGHNSLEAQIDLECELQREMGHTDDYLEGMRAFAEKRPPRFTGR